MNKVLIVYASKTGVTQDAARAIAAQLSIETALFDCRGNFLDGPDGTAEKGIPPLSEYGGVVLGTAMYVGAPLKEFKRFCAVYENELLSLPLVLFTCGVETAETDERYLQKSLPSSLTRHALIYRHLGGEVRPERLSAFERMAMKQFEKQHGKAHGIDEAAVRELCRAVSKYLDKEL